MRELHVAVMLTVREQFEFDRHFAAVVVSHFPLQEACKCWQIKGFLKSIALEPLQPQWFAAAPVYLGDSRVKLQEPHITGQAGHVTT